MVGVVRPWTKWAVEVERLEDLPSAVRRAVQLALTPPTGPVFLALPMDLQMAEAGDLDLTPGVPLSHRLRPPLDALRAAAVVLAAAANPAILVGSRVTEADAVAELVAVAERLGAPVFSEPGHAHGRLGFPADHPLYGQTIPLWAPEIARRLAEFDVLLVVGMDLLRQYVYHEPSRPIPEHIRLVHLDESPYQIGKNYPVEVGVLGDSKVGLAELDALLATHMSQSDCQRAAARGQARARLHREIQAKLREQIAAQQGTRPMTPGVLMESLSRVLPPDVAVVEEAVTTTNTCFSAWARSRTPAAISPIAVGPSAGDWAVRWASSWPGPSGRCWPCWARGPRCTAFRPSGRRPIIS